MSVQNRNVAPETSIVIHGMTESFLPASYFLYCTTSSTKQNIFTISTLTQLPYLSQNSFLRKENVAVRHTVNHGSSLECQLISNCSWAPIHFHYYHLFPSSCQTGHPIHCHTVSCLHTCTGTLCLSQSENHNSEKQVTIFYSPTI